MKVALVIIGALAVINLLSTAALWNSRTESAVRLSNRVIEMQRAEEEVGAKLVDAAERAQTLNAAYNELLAENNKLISENNEIVSQNNGLFENYNILVEEYNNLLKDHNALLAQQ